jgi:hypothetical protein
MNIPNEHDIITAGLTVGTGTYVARLILGDAIAAIFEIYMDYKDRRSKVKG